MVSLTTLNFWSLIGARPVLQIALLFTILYRILSDVIFLFEEKRRIAGKRFKRKITFDVLCSLWGEVFACHCDQSASGKG